MQLIHQISLSCIALAILSTAYDFDDSANVQSVFDTESTNFCKMNKGQFIGETCEVTFHELNDINSDIREDLVSLVNSDFFRFFKLDLYKECPFWDDNNGYCVNRACAVDVIEDWDSLPEYWQPEVLGSLDNITNDINITDDTCSFLEELCQNRKIGSKEDVQYCDVNDFHSKDSVIVDLTANPERFTGYGGEQSSQIWSSIYNENCFSLEGEDKCLAKDAFYRLISGLHASIATHLSNDHLNTETGEWEPDLDLFMARVGNFPDRVSNIYFNYAVVAKALWKIRPYLNGLDICSAYNEDVKHKIGKLVSKLDSKIFNEDLLFSDDVSSRLKDDFRSRFKNVTKIMDCVHCDRCRLWGKVQITGYATSLKILFEMDAANITTGNHIVERLTKYEFIALLNTFDRLSKSLESIAKFENLYNNRLEKNGRLFPSIFQLDNFFRLIGSKFQNASLFSEYVTVEDPKEAERFNDLKMPEKSSTSVDGRMKHIWLDAWYKEWRNFKEALKFIFSSYVNLPSIIGKVVLLHLNRVWNKFIGVPSYLPEEEPIYPSYELNI